MNIENDLRILNYIYIGSIIIIIFGLVGNFFVAMVYSTRSLRKFSITTYYLFISFFDTLPLVDYFLNHYLKYQHYYDITILSDFMCKTFGFYFSYSIGPISHWLLVMVSLDRFFSVYFIHRFPIIYKLKFQLSVIAFIIVFNIFSYSPLIWKSHLSSYVTLNFNGSESDPQEVVIFTYCNTDYYSWEFWMDLFNSSLVPFTFMIVLSIAIIIRIKKSRYRSNSMRLTTSTSNSMVPNRICRRDRKFAITSITLNLFFLCLSLPSVTLNLLYHYKVGIGDNSQTDFVTSHIVNLFYHGYYASGFYVQFCVNSLFRDTFWSMVKKVYA